MPFSITYTFVPGTTIFSAQVNTNFSNLVNQGNVHEAATTGIHGVGAGNIMGTTLIQNVSNKTFTDNLVWLSGTGNQGILDHANTANRTYTFPDASGTVRLSGSIVPVSEGGTGVNTIPIHALMIGNNTNPINTVAVGATGTVLRGQTGADPVFGQVVLTTDVTGILPEANGGTNQSTYAQGDLLYASAANTLSKLAKDANATRYLSNTGAGNNPAWAQVNLTNGVTGVLPPANGGVSGFTAASVPFADGGGTLTEDNANFSFDNANNRLNTAGYSATSRDTAYGAGKFNRLMSVEFMLDAVTTGANPVTVNDSYNLGSIVWSHPGSEDLYTVTFATPMDHANYVVVGCASEQGASEAHVISWTDGSKTVNGIQLRIVDMSDTTTNVGVQFTLAILGGRN